MTFTSLWRGHSQDHKYLIKSEIYDPKESLVSKNAKTPFEMQIHFLISSRRGHSLDHNYMLENKI